MNMNSVTLSRPVSDVVSKLVETAHTYARVRIQAAPGTASISHQPELTSRQHKNPIEVCFQRDSGEAHSRVGSEISQLQNPPGAREKFGPVACLFRWYSKRNASELPYQQCRLHLHHQPHANPFDGSLVPDLLKCPLPDPALLMVKEGQRDKLNTAADPVLNLQEVMSMMEDFKVVPNLVAPQDVRAALRAALGQPASPVPSEPPARTPRLPSPQRSPRQLGLGTQIGGASREASAQSPPVQRSRVSSTTSLPASTSTGSANQGSGVGPSTVTRSSQGSSWEGAGRAQGSPCPMARAGRSPGHRRSPSPTRAGLPHPEDLHFSHFCDMLVRIACMLRTPGGKSQGPVAGIRLLQEALGLAHGEAELRQQLASIDDTAYERGFRRTALRWSYVASQEARNLMPQAEMGSKELQGWLPTAPMPTPKHLLDALMRADAAAQPAAKMSREWVDYDSDLISTGPVRVGQTRNYRLLIRNRSTHSMLFVVDTSELPFLTACYSDTLLVPGKPAVVELTARFDRVGEYQADITIMARPTAVQTGQALGQQTSEAGEHRICVPFRVTCFGVYPELEADTAASNS